MKIEIVKDAKDILLDELVKETKSAIQTLYNLAYGDLTGDAAEIAINAASRLNSIISNRTNRIIINIKE